MNKQRAKRVDEALDLIRKIADDFEQAKSMLRELADEERECFENYNEGLQASEQGQRADECATALENAADAMEAIDSLEELANEVDAVI